MVWQAIMFKPLGVWDHCDTTISTLVSPSQYQCNWPCGTSRNVDLFLPVQNFYLFRLTLMEEHDITRGLGTAADQTFDERRRVFTLYNPTGIHPGAATSLRCRTPVHLFAEKRLIHVSTQVSRYC